ncbi:MAG: NYN domain-containing protein [Candidatus Gracilibacteria bacterium]
MDSRLNNYAFIDSQNLNLAIRRSGWQLDFGKFRVYLKDKYKITKAFLFIGYCAWNKKLYSKLREMGYIVIFKPTSHNEHGKIKGNCDAELVLHCVTECKNFNKAIIVSGDGDFYCLIKYLSENNKLLKVCIPNRAKYSEFFRPFKDCFVFINDLKMILEYKKGEVS